jgi:hypothetical protein
MTARRAAALALGLCVAMVVTGCGAAGNGPAAAPAPPRVPGEATAGPDLTGVKLPNFTMPMIRGKVSRPNHQLTPGSVVSTDTAALCAMSKAAARAAIPFTTQTAVYTQYGYSDPAVQRKYSIDYLVPVDLGGDTTTANLWPAAIRGTGFFQKNQLDHILYDMVCRRTITITAAQGALERDWYAAWLQYVVATGHA